MTGSVRLAFVTDKATCALTVVGPVPVLLKTPGSVVVVVAVAELVMTVPCAVLAGALTTSVNTELALAASDVAVNVIVPVPPAGTASVRVQLAGVVTETK